MFKASRVSNIQGGSLCMTDARSGITKWGECLALKLQLFHKLIVISSEKLISSNLGLFSHVNPFCFLYHGLKTILVFISYQLNGSERISTMYLKTVIFRHSILDNSSIPLTPAKQRSIFYQNMTDSVKKDPPMQNKTTLYGMSGIEQTKDKALLH